MRRDASGLLIRLADGDWTQAPSVVSISDQLGCIPRKIIFEDGSAFEVEHDADLRFLDQQEPRMKALLTQLERKTSVAIGAFLASALLIAASIVWGIPSAAHGLALVTPRPVVATMDDALRSSLDRITLLPSTLPKARQEEIRQGFTQLLRHAGPLDAEPVLLFKGAGGIGPNALALPGGTIILTDELVRLAVSDDEILGVLAHEIGHVEERHGLRQLYVALGIGAVVSMVGGDPGSLVDAVATQAGALHQLSFSRGFETHADKRSVEIMLAAGRDPVAFMALLQRLAARQREGPSLLRTHPGTPDREAQVKAHAASLGWRGR